MSVRSGWDAAGIYLAVEASATGWRPPGALGAAGDRLLVGIDPLDEHATRSPLLLALALVDGRPRVDVLAGTLPPEMTPADQPRLRIAAGAAQVTYELLVPWPLLRAKPDHRPGHLGRMRIGVAAETAGGGAREWGGGLVRGFAPDLLPTLELDGR